MRSLSYVTMTLGRRAPNSFHQLLELETNRLTWAQKASNQQGFHATWDLPF
jgi:hypothetical protein